VKEAYFLMAKNAEPNTAALFLEFSRHTLFIGAVDQR
jgi:hypothetical protein